MAAGPFDGAGGGEGVFQLTAGSVSPSRLVARDELGRPTEETVCVLAKHAKFVDTKGNVCTVPLQCGRVFNRSSEAERYETFQIRDQIDAGCLPLEECPHTQAYEKWIGEVNGGRLVKAPKNYESCRGKKQPADHPIGVDFLGCEHMEKIIKARRLRAREEHDAEMGRMSMSMTAEHAAALIRAAAQGGAAGYVDPRARLAAGISDPEPGK